MSARPLLNDIGGIRGGVIVFRDVTERVFAEEALTQAFAEGRLEIVDTILHNIGNAITSVTTGIETVRRGLRVLRDPLVKRGVRTSIDCRRAPREIRVRESQFHQMLVNLIKNAIEAIDDLATERGLARTPSIRMRAYSGDKYLNVEVADSGIGLRTGDTRRLFAPGYTTKAAGSGLGLHSAANFVIAAGGRIEALSDSFGRGTTMRIMLPLSSVLPRAPGAHAGSQ